MTTQGRRRPKARGMWLVQVAEYAIGIAVATTVPRSPDAVLVAGVAVAIVANAATLNAPLAAFPRVRAGAHRIVGIVLSIVVLLLVLVPSVDVGTRAAFVLAGVAQGFVSVRFGHGLRTSRSRSRQADQRLGGVGKG